MHRRSTFGAIITALLTAACNHAGAQDAGPDASRSFAVGEFDRIEVSGPYHVQVHTGAQTAISATGPEKMLEHMLVEVQDGELLIRPRKDAQRMAWSGRSRVEVEIHVPMLRAAGIAGAGDVRIDNIRGNEFEGTIKGSGDIDIANLETKALRLSIAGSGNVRAAAGQTESADLKIGGSGDIDTKGITAQTASATIAGSGNIAATAKDTAAVRIMGAGDVEITGGAKCTVDNKGAGSFRCS